MGGGVASGLGVVEPGRPDPDHPRLLRARALRPRLRLVEEGAGPVSLHATAVALALLESLDPDEEFLLRWWSLAPAADPSAWLAALQGLARNGVRWISLSWGRRRVEAGEGWAALEEGASRLHRRTGLRLVVAAGRPCAALPEGFAPHLPGRAAGAVAVDGPARFAARSPRPEERKIVLADDADPLGGRPGSSFAAPREAVRRWRTDAERPPNAGPKRGLC